MKNQTALITGASSGIGAEFARRLAATGTNLIISARRVERLESLATELRTAHSIDVKVVAADLARPDGATILADAVGDRDIDILINNAGWGHIGHFVEEDAVGITEELQVNVVSLTQLTRAFLPGMVRRNRGVVINLASTAAYQPVPNMAVYGATKAYVLSFTEALWGELRGTEVRVLALSPGGTATEFFDIAGGRAMNGGLDTPQHVVEVAMAALESKKRPPSVIVGARNSVMATANRFVDRATVIKVASKVMRPNK